MLQARVCDPSGPRWWRVVTAVGLFPLVVLVPVAPSKATWIALVLGLAWLAVGRIVVPRLRPRDCSMESRRAPSA